ncbi:DUF2065 domain-containing protein [Halovulum dunhuangense]|uniref:DUF2065 domain-containing protein n=1 Tax=Halovulum dunhuangense TaxID=1505036 RepID=A0A849L201_9RHOB|nr:DUF2065 domain-containing protein [Halovulum dunhuangense]NNU80257.1 DUF2065 domain-containing protein [Halovulum dunhuangense]
MSWADLLTGLGIAAVLEGLVLALAPSRIDEVLEAIRRIPPEARRSLGLGVVALGVTLVWIAQG